MNIIAQKLRRTSAMRATTGRGAALLAVAVITTVGHGQKALGQSQLTRPLESAKAINDRIAITVSGGVSLGSYQAGSTWAMTFMLRHDSVLASRRERIVNGIPATLAPVRYYDLDVLTGASAGNANAVLAGLEYCAESFPVNPEESLFWKAWIPMGLKELLSEGASPGDRGIFSRATVDTMWRTVDQAMQRKGRSCDLGVGITTTKLTPDIVRIANGINIPIQRFAGVFKIIGDTAGQEFATPSFADVNHRDLTDLIILDPVDRSGTTHQLLRLRTNPAAFKLPGNAVRELVKASGAFPVAFAPGILRYRTVEDLRWVKDSASIPCIRRMLPVLACLGSREERFVDGGIFDNRPLGLALGMSRVRDDAVTHRLEQSYRAQRDSLLLIACGEGATRAIVVRLAVADSIARALRAQYDTAAAQEDPFRNPRQDSLERARGDALIAISATIDQKNMRCTERLGALLRELTTERSPVANQLPARLIYFIDDDARRTDIPRNNQSAAEPKGGIAAGMRVVANAFETGQNTELRLFAHRLRSGGGGTNAVGLGVNSRYPRLMAEHLQHFGAFLAKTFRRHDFYAGVYDGIRSASRELHCRPDTRSAATDSTLAACEVAWLRLVLESDVAQLTPEARATIDRMFAHESGQRFDTLPSGLPGLAGALVALVDANVNARRPEKKECDTQAFFVEAPLCSEDLLPVIEEWARLLDLGPSQYKDNVCADDREVCRFIKSPRGQYHGAVLDILKSMRNTEAHHAQNGKGYPKRIGIPLYLEREYNQQFMLCTVDDRSRCLSPNPSTADVYPGWWYSGVSHLLPVTIGGFRDGKSHWLQWRPTANLGRLSATTFALIAPVEFVTTNGSYGATGGVGLTIFPAWLPVSTLSISNNWDSDGIPRADVTMGLVAGIVRVGYRQPPDKGPRWISRGNLTLGMGDVNGIGSRVISYSARRVWDPIRKLFPK